MHKEPDPEQAKRYTRVAMFLHWTVAVMIATNILLVWIVDRLPDDFVRPTIDTHKSLGISVFGLVLLHLLWRTAHPPPALPDAYPVGQRRAARVGHFVLYVLIIALPITGWLHDSAWKDAAQYPMKLFYLISWPRIALIADLDPVTKEVLHGVFGKVHTWLSYVFYGVFVLHICGALKHQFWDCEPQLQRMLPWGKIDV